MRDLRSTLLLALACTGCAAASAPAPTVAVPASAPAPAPADPGEAARQPAPARRPGDAIARMPDQIGVVRERLARKRAMGDWVASGCESDRLTQLHVTYRAAREQDASLRRAQAEGDQDAIVRAQNLLDVLVRRADELAEDVCRCSGLAGLGNRPSQG